MTEPRGVGIGLRRSFASDLLRTERRVDWLEIIPENFLGKPGPFRHALEALAGRYPIGAHGVSLSLGGPDPFDDEALAALKSLLDDLAIERMTEHLCFATARGFHSHDLIALPYTEEAVRWAAGRIREAEDRLERPIDVENVSTYARMPGSVMSEGEFVRAVVEEAGCGLLLDVNNVYVSARNASLDPAALLAAMPLSRTRRVHVAGHLDKGAVCIDDHGHPVRDEVWALLGAAVAEIGDVPVLLEWDTDVPALDRVLDEADRARDVVTAALRSRTPQVSLAVSA